MSGYEQFQTNFEQESDRVFYDYSKLTEDNLLEIITNRHEHKYGIWQGRDNYQIWRAIGIKGTQHSIQPLFNIISNLKNDYLIRYHTCDALFSIAGIRDKNIKEKILFGRDENKNPVDQLEAFSELEQILKFKTTDLKLRNKRPWWKFWG
jgi:hypothetical protein